MISITIGYLHTWYICCPYVDLGSDSRAHVPHANRIIYVTGGWVGGGLGQSGGGKIAW